MNSIRRIAAASAVALSMAFAPIHSARADQPAGTTKVAVVDVQRAVMQTEDGLRAQA